MPTHGEPYLVEYFRLNSNFRLNPFLKKTYNFITLTGGLWVGGFETFF